jgi:hypothetical protein
MTSPRHRIIPEELNLQALARESHHMQRFKNVMAFGPVQLSTSIDVILQGLEDELWRNIPLPVTEKLKSCF